MKILFVGAEVAPLAKVGGLADVMGSLPKALIELGHDVKVLIPRYGCINTSQITAVGDSFAVPVMGRQESAVIQATSINNGAVPVYMVDNKTYFGGNTIYSDNDLERYLFFSRAVVEVLPKLDWQPEIVHCHDWHAALVVMMLKKLYPSYASVFTVHNLAYQGFLDETFLQRAQLKEYWDNYPAGAPKPPFNYMSQGILWSDLVTTVSETYAKDIITAEFGVGLDHLLRYRQDDLLGMVNGIDYEEYNPQTDPHLPANYDSASLDRRVVNKLGLQKRANLPQDVEIPLIGMVQRLDEQKGFDILEKAADRILKETHAQLVILGGGREHYENMVRQIAARYPQQMAVFTAFDNPLAHLIYGSCDMFLMPSRFEPCGLGQLIAMRYGAVPVVRQTGGLVDTVAPLSPDLQKGSGFMFREYLPESLFLVVRAAVEVFKNRDAWRQVQQRVMKLDFSWQASAAKYEAAYRKVLRK